MCRPLRSLDGDGAAQLGPSRLLSRVLELGEPRVAEMCDLESVLEPLARWCVEEREADLEVVLIFGPQAVGLVQQLDLGS